MIRDVKIYRIEKGDAGVFGATTINGEAFCVSLELPDRNNKVGVSCIPAGLYECRRYQSPRFGETFQVMDVDGRTYILFHAGNTTDDSRGCVLLGQYFGKLRGDHVRRAVLNSGKTFRAFMDRMVGVDSFNLEIVEV